MPGILHIGAFSSLPGSFLTSSTGFPATPPTRQIPPVSGPLTLAGLCLGWASSSCLYNWFPPSFLPAFSQIFLSLGSLPWPTYLKSQLPNTNACPFPAVIFHHLTQYLCSLLSVSPTIASKLHQGGFLSAVLTTQSRQPINTCWMNTLYHPNPQHPCRMRVVSSPLEMRKLRQREFQWPALNLELPHLAKKNLGHPINFEYQKTKQKRNLSKSISYLGHNLEKSEILSEIQI